MWLGDSIRDNSRSEVSTPLTPDCSVRGTGSSAPTIPFLFLGWVLSTGVLDTGVSTFPVL